ncbi:alpha/beta hydrolase [Luteimonas sp. A478]
MFKSLILMAAALLLSGCTFTYREAYLVSPRPDQAPELDVLREEFPDHHFREGRIDAGSASLYTLAMTHPDARATVLYFGGNGYRTGRSAPYSARVYAPLPVNLVLVDHRGYGTSTGSPGVDALMGDALRAHDHVAGDASLQALPLIVHGQSLGSFMAGHVAANRQLGGLVLESSVTTTSDWVAYQRSRLPWWKRMWVRRIDLEGSLAEQGNLPVVVALDEPVLFVVGEDDPATPPEFTRRLYEATALPDSCRSLLVVPGRGHNDATRSQAFADAMTAFVAQIAEENPACLPVGAAREGLNVG